MGYCEWKLILRIFSYYSLYILIFQIVKEFIVLISNLLVMTQFAHPKKYIVIKAFLAIPIRG